MKTRHIARGLHQLQRTWNSSTGLDLEACSGTRLHGRETGGRGITIEGIFRSWTSASGMAFTAYTVRREDGEWQMSRLPVYHIIAIRKFDAMRMSGAVIRTGLRSITCSSTCLERLNRTAASRTIALARAQPCSVQEFALIYRLNPLSNDFQSPVMRLR